MISIIISETDEVNFHKIGKTSISSNIKLTINSYTNRIITTDKLKENKI